MIWSALLVAAAVELWRPSDRRVVAVRFRRPVQVWRPSRIRPSLVVLPASFVLPFVLDGPIALLAVVLLAAVLVVSEQTRSRRRQSHASRCREQLVEAISFLVAELRAGALPETALSSVASDFAPLAPAARAAGAAVDVVPMLNDAAFHPGCGALIDLGAAWRVADRSGAPVAGVLSVVVERLRADIDLDREVAAEVAPARATARMMALLPVVGLALGAGAGGDPIAVVIGTWPGAVSASCGIALAVIGLAWIERVAARAAR